MKNLKLYITLFVALFFGCISSAVAQTDTLEHEVLLETTMGNIRVKLYNDTPIHRDNF